MILEMLVTLVAGMLSIAWAIGLWWNVHRARRSLEAIQWLLEWERGKGPNPELRKEGGG